MNQSKKNKFYSGGKNKYNNKPFQGNKNKEKDKEVENMATLTDIPDTRPNNNDDKFDGFSSFSDYFTSSMSAFSKPKPISPSQNMFFDTGTYTIRMDSAKVKEKPKKMLRPKQIKEHLDQYVIGQEEAKISLSVAIYNHYKRVNSQIDDDGIEIQKSNILMLGNSGSGKTLLAQTIAKILDVPFASFDATTFTPTGIVGKDVESIITDLISAANGDRKKAEKGIIYIDEFDKIAGNGMSRETHNVKGVLGGDTQASFLKLIEGNEVKTNSTSMYGNSTKLDTKNILFICGGAFAGIDELVKKKDCGKHIGFEAENKKCEVEDVDVWDKIGAEEVIKYGMMPEIVGRLPVMLKLKPLEKIDLINILTQPKNAIVKQYQKLLSMDRIHLDFSSDALELIAELAMNNKTGARGLRGILEKVMTKLMFNLPDDEYERKCLITSEHIKNNLIPELF